MRPQLIKAGSAVVRLSPSALKLQPTRPSPIPALKNLSSPSQRPFTTNPQLHHPANPPAATMATPVSANSLIELIKNRRSHYPLSKDLPISKERVQEIVNEAMLHVPSSFNSQSNRAVVLFGDAHEKLWDLTTGVLKGIVPEDSWKATGDKMGMFKGAAGTILFFDDQTVVQSMQAKFAIYSDKFPVWAAESNAMLQYTLWVALEAEGLGANLQHYNPIIDEKVAAEWKLPASWTLKSQLVFGGKTGEAGDKAYQPLEERVKVFGA